VGSRVAGTGEMRTTDNQTTFFFRKRKRLLGRPKSRWNETIQIDFREMESQSVGWTDVAEDRWRWRDLVCTVLNARVRLEVEAFLTSWTTASFLRVTVLHCV
jgi:hypothetical protein